MAVIKCWECGHDVSHMAMICPNCGFPVMMLSADKVRIRFDAGHLPGNFGGKADLIIDGNAVGCAGFSFDILLSPGEHSLVFRGIDKVFDSKETLLIPDGVRFVRAYYGVKNNGKEFTIKYVRPEG